MDNIAKTIDNLINRGTTNLDVVATTLLKAGGSMEPNDERAQLYAIVAAFVVAVNSHPASRAQALASMFEKNRQLQ